jgi:hypothetical protein
MAGVDEARHALAPGGRQFLGHQAHVAHRVGTRRGSRRPARSAATASRGSRRPPAAGGSGSLAIGGTHGCGGRAKPIVEVEPQ